MSIKWESVLTNAVECFLSQFLLFPFRATPISDQIFKEARGNSMIQILDSLRISLKETISYLLELYYRIRILFAFVGSHKGTSDLTDHTRDFFYCCMLLP